MTSRMWNGYRVKPYEIGICCFSTKHTALKSKSKDWLAQNLDAFEWSDTETIPEEFWFRELTLQMFFIRVDPVQSGYHHHIIKYDVFSP